MQQLWHSAFMPHSSFTAILSRKVPAACTPGSHGVASRNLDTWVLCPGLLRDMPRLCVYTRRRASYSHDHFGCFDRHRNVAVAMGLL